PFGMWLPVAVLVALVVVIGLLPGLFAQAIVARTASAVVGAELTDLHLSIWHGFTPALAMSMLALMGGLAMLAAYGPINAWRMSMLRPEAKRMFAGAIHLCVLAARRVMDLSHTQSLPRYAGVIMLAVISLGALGFFTGTHGAGDRATIPASGAAYVAWLILAVACAIVVVRQDDRLLT